MFLCFYSMEAWFWWENSHDLCFSMLQINLNWKDTWLTVELGKTSFNLEDYEDRETVIWHLKGQRTQSFEKNHKRVWSSASLVAETTPVIIYFTGSTCSCLHIWLQSSCLWILSSGVMGTYLTTSFPPEFPASHWQILLSVKNLVLTQVLN